MSPASKTRRGGFGGGDVLKHDFKLRHLRQNGFHYALDKGGFAVEDVDFGVGYFAMNEEQDACFAISSNTGMSLNRSVTPESELVVAPAG